MTHSSRATPTLAQMATYLDRTLDSSRFPKDQPSIYRDSSYPIARIGLALEPWPSIERWVEQERLDALFLHRPWKLEEQKLPERVGVLTSHLAFDATLTFGFNQRLAQALSLSQLVPFAYKDNVPLGMRGTIKPAPLQDVLAMLTEVFGTMPRVKTISVEKVERIAVVGAMNSALIREAAAQSIELYLTGQFRPSAALAVQETGMTVAEVGHGEGERWGLRALAGLLRERWYGLEVVLPQER